MASLLISCGDSAEKTPTAESFSCLRGADSCDTDCTEGQCIFVVEDALDYTLSCDGGECILNALGTGTIDLSCDGGSCHIASLGTGTVNIDCSGGSCSTASCDGIVNIDCTGGDCYVACTQNMECNLESCPTEDCVIEPINAAQCD